MSKLTIDLEIKNALNDLQGKIMETRKKIAEIDTEKNDIARLVDVAQLNLLGITSVQEGTNTYEAVGRMFLKRDSNKLKMEFDERHEELNVMIKELNDNKEYLEKNLKESRQNIREMIQVKKGQSDVKVN